MTLNLPSFEYLKSITDVDEEIIVFQVIEGVYGQITVNEDGEKYFWFDLVVNGYTGTNQWSRRFDKTKKGYYKLCVYAQMCYNIILNNLLSQDYTWQYDEQEWKKNKED